MDTTILDLTPVIEVLITLAGAVLLGIGGFVIHVLNRYAQRLGLDRDGQMRDALEQALANAVVFAEDLARERTANLRAVDVRHAMVTSAAQYVVDAVPDTLRRLGVSPERVPDLVRARIVRELEGVETPPLTPSAMAAGDKA